VKLYEVEVTIVYPVKKYTYEKKVVADSEEEAIQKLIDFEMITPSMICESLAIEIEGVV